VSGADAAVVSVHDVVRRLKIAGIEAPALEARLLIAAALSRAADELHGVASVTVTAGQRQHLDDLVARRINREPIAYITGMREFWSLPLKTSPDVLIPRADSETVVEAVCAAMPDRAAPLRVLDLGTGSGCLLLALLSEFPNAAGVGIDAAPASIALAAANAAELGMAARVRFIELDWREPENPLYTNLCRLRFDVVVSNPPYIAARDMPHLMRDVRDYEPHLALLGGADGLCAYRQILPLVDLCLEEAGVSVLECGSGQAGDVMKIAQDQGFVEGRCALDLAGIERCVVLRRGRQKNLLESEGRGARLAPEGPTKS